MDIRAATQDYERWVGRLIPIVVADLKLKHERMAESLFAFLRATFYRWCQLWTVTVGEVQSAPSVLAVGDLHIENFGSWRDSEGRLIWGVNDFDEAYSLPYTFDLVRLVVSARLAADQQHLALHHHECSDAVLDGYWRSLESGGGPFVLEEHHHVLRAMVLSDLRDPVHFWKKMNDLPDGPRKLPAEARRGLQALLPNPRLPFRVKRRVAGLGSLGHPRYVALAEWGGGSVAREAKALRSSACVWAAGGKGSAKVQCGRIVDQAVRVPDPFVRFQGRWLFRRLAPDCSRIELVALPKERDEVHLLHAMGRETANIHLGSRAAAPAILRDLKRRPSDWLHRAARAMGEALARDWADWRRG